MKFGYLQKINLIFWCMFIALVAYLLLVIYVHPLNSVVSGKQEVISIIEFTIPVVAIIGLMLSSIFYKTKIRSVDEKSGIYQKLGIYRSAIIIKLTCLEGPALIAAFAFLITSSTFYFAITVFMMFVMLVNRPSKVEMKSDLKLEEEELQTLMHSHNSSLV